MLLWEVWVAAVAALPELVVGLAVKAAEVAAFVAPELVVPESERSVPERSVLVAAVVAALAPAVCSAMASSMRGSAQ